MTGFAQSRGVPAAGPASSPAASCWRWGLSLLLGIWPDLGALLLVMFLVPTAFLTHGFWKETDAQARQMEMVQFFKDLGLAGAALIPLGVFSQFGDDVGLTITGPLF